MHLFINTPKFLANQKTLLLCTGSIVLVIVTVAFALLLQQEGFQLPDQLDNLFQLMITILSHPCQVIYCGVKFNMTHCTCKFECNVLLHDIRIVYVLFEISIYLY